MSTSLATQLRNLAVPSTNALTDRKKRVSLLFDPKEAANIGADVIYEIGLEGLEQLIVKSDIFEEFRATLFNISSKDFDRNVQTKVENNKLNKSIKRFLAAVAPYILTNSAHKALEWLYYRFTINEFNKQDLIMLALPYYSSNIFTRIIQTLKFDEPNDQYYFLNVVKKSGMHLPRLDLFYQALSNASVIKGFTKFMNQILAIHTNYSLLTTLFNFYGTVFCGAIEFVKEISEPFVTQMLPLLLKGLDSQIPDYAAATFIIIARLLSKATLSSKLLNTFVEKVAELNCPLLKLEAALVLVLIYQLQTQYEELPVTVLDRLVNSNWLVNSLEKLHSKGNSIYSFLRVVVRTAVGAGVGADHAKLRELVLELIGSINFDGYFIKPLLSIILDSIDENAMTNENINAWLHAIIKQLEIKQSLNLNLAIADILKDTTISPKRKSFIKTTFETLNETYAVKFKIINILFDNDHKPVGDNTFQTIQEHIKKLQPGDQYLFSNMLCEKLHDPNPNVVERTLELLIKTDVGEGKLLQTSLLDLFRDGKCLLKKWEKSYILAAHYILKEQEFNWNVFVDIFPFVLVYYSKAYADMQKVFKQPFFTKSKLFAGFNAARYPTPKDFIDKFWSCLEANLDILEQCLDSMLQSDHISSINHYIYLLLVSHMCSKIVDLPITHIEKIFQAFQFGQSKLRLNEYNTQEEYLKVAFNNKLPLKGVLSCMDNIIAKTVIDEESTNWTSFDLYHNSGYKAFLSGLCSFTYSHPSLKTAFISFLGKTTKDVNNQITTCLNICASSVLTEDFVCNILTIIKELLSEKIGGLNKFTALYLLVLYSSNNDAIRKLAIELTELLLKHCSDDTQYIWLLKQFVLFKEEIGTDCEQTSLICFNLLTPGGQSKQQEHAKVLLEDLLKTVCSSNVPIYVKLGVLKALSHINNFEMCDLLCNHFLTFFQTSPLFDDQGGLILMHLIRRIDLAIIPNITLTSDIWKFIAYILQNKSSVIIDGELIYLPCYLLNHLSRDACAVFADEVLQKLLDHICEHVVVTEQPEIVSIANKIFKHLILNVKLISHLLSAMKEVQSSTGTSGKKRRSHVAPTVDILDTLAWKKGVCILEFLQGKKKIKNGSCLLPLLFDILKKCLDFEEQAAVEYTKQLILSLILLVCSREDEDISEQNFNIELVIQCIRASQNPQTHYHALLALAQAAKFVPNEVLHHVMAVFTFMGSTLIRHDDAYSFEIISKIVDTIIPILVGSETVTTIADVLRVFVDALLDVPEHRRIPLYMKVLTNIDAKRNLHTFVLLVLEAEVVQNTREKQKEKGERSNIVLALCQEFPPDITLHACVLLAKYLNDLPEEAEQKASSINETSVINFTAFNAKQFRHFKYSIIMFLSKLLSSKTFVNKVSMLSDEENIKVESLYKELIISVLAFIQKSQKIRDKSAHSPQETYWQIMLHHAYQLLDRVNDLLTPHMFLLVIKGLLMHNIPTVKKRALELLNHNLQADLSKFKEEDKLELYVLVQPVVIIIKTLEEENLQLDQETLIQTALLSLKLIVKILGPQDPEKFVQILDFVGSILNSGKAKDNVLASVILCLAELCIVLRGHGLVGLTSFMPAFLTILKKQKFQETSSMLLISVITTISKLLDSFAAFLSPYLTKLVFETSILISKWSDAAEDPKLQPLVARLQGIKKKLSVVIPSRILIPTIEECYDILIEKSYFNALVALIDIMEEQLGQFQSSDIASNMAELTNFFLKALQFRCDCNSTMEVANLVEDQVVKTLVVFILKLSESSFRPFYLKLYDWVVRSKDNNSERLITFYHLSEQIGLSLKGLFTLFAGNIINNLSEILRSITPENYLFNNDQKKTVLLLEYALKTLHVIFTYDNKKLINRDRFELLMQPLVDLLEKDIDGVESLVKRNEMLITPTIVQFSLAIADDSLWKEMNYQILLKMRNANPDIRLVTLHCLTEVVAKLREDFLPLLPETIPFLAELLEDEDERVERFCQKTIREMETVLGEPLQKYF